jgi:hypothetical protein
VESNWWNDWQGQPNYTEKTCPSAALSTTNPTCCPDANPGRRGGKPATNRLSYGTASIISCGAKSVAFPYNIFVCQATWFYLHYMNISGVQVCKSQESIFPFRPNTVKPVSNGAFIKRDFVLNGNLFTSRDYHSILWLNGNLASAEKCSGPLRFHLRQVLLY